MRAALFLLLTGLTLGACSAPPAEPPGGTPTEDPATLGTITGQVVLAGTPPPRQAMRLDGDPKCVELLAGEVARSEEVITTADGGLLNVFIYVSQGVPQRLYPVPAAPVVLDQQRCRYTPRVVGVQVGQQLHVLNSDPLLHNVRGDAQINQPFDVGTPVQGMKITRTFATREIMVPLTCSVHAWMDAYVGVLEHPYFAVTDEQGRFALPALPAGTYSVTTWHERYGSQTLDVTVTAAGTSSLTFRYQEA